MGLTEVDGSGRAWMLGRALIHVFSTLSSIPAHQDTTRNICLSCLSWSDSTRHTAPANRLPATTSLVCWLLGMVPGCLGWHALGQHCLGSPTLECSSIFPMALQPVAPECLFGSLLACQPACGLGLLVASQWPRGRANRSGLWSCLRPSVVVTPMAGSIGKQDGQRWPSCQATNRNASLVHRGHRQGPRPAAPRCWVSFLQQPKSVSVLHTP